MNGKPDLYKVGSVVVYVGKLCSNFVANVSLAHSLFSVDFP